MIDRTGLNRGWVDLLLVVFLILPLDVASPQSSGSNRERAGSGSLLSSTLDVRYLGPASPLVLKGSVMDVRKIDETAVRGEETSKMAVSIKVLRVLKGSLQRDRITVSFALDPSPIGLRLRVGDCDLLFLKAEKGEYVFMDPMVAVVPISSREIPTADLGSSMRRIQMELLASLSDPDHHVRETALDQIQRISKSESIAVLRNLAKSPDLKSKGMAYSGLIHLGDYGLFSETIQFIESRAMDDPDLQYWKARCAQAIGAIGENRLTEAREAVNYNEVVNCPSKVKTKVPFDPTLVRELEALVSAPDVGLRESAIHALRGVCDPTSAGELARALRDSDRRVQYDALMGLAALEGFPKELPAPTETRFNLNPASYIGPWESWWEQSGERKYSSHP